MPQWAQAGKALVRLFDGSDLVVLTPDLAESSRPFLRVELATVVGGR